MDRLELLVYNVGHGLSLALVERPENYVVLIDLGSDTGFTPLKDLSLSRKLRPDILYITHPHADHINDVETALDSKFKPLGINYQQYDWEEVKEKEKPELAYKIDKFQELQRSVPFKNYSGSAILNHWWYTPDNAKKNFGDSSYVNNSSYFIVYKWRDFKIAVGGDLENAAINGMVNFKDIQDFAKGTDIFIPAHHGHKSGFSSDWVSKIGKPFVSIISVQESNPHVDSRYSSSDFAKGITFNGETRYALTTRNDGNIQVEMFYGQDGGAKWNFSSF